jgi:hypothetical protein
MISEEEKQKYCEATKCSNCTQWLHHCDAECCRSIFLNIDPKELENGSKYYDCRVGVLGLDEIRYYKYHDVAYVRGLLRFKKERIHVIGRKVVYLWTCSKLKDNLCLDHPDKKPELCKLLTAETAMAGNDAFRLTSNCLFKYKSKEVKQDD